MNVWLKSAETATATEGIALGPASLVARYAQACDNLLSFSQSVFHLGINAVAYADLDLNWSGLCVFIRFVQHIDRACHGMLAVLAWAVSFFRSRAVSTRCVRRASGCHLHAITFNFGCGHFRRVKAQG